MPATLSNNLILSDGSIIVAGWSAGSTPICYALAKYGSNGVLSTKVASAVSTGSGAAYSGEHSGIALQANAEKIVTAGWVSNGSDNDFFIARYVGGIGGASPTLRVRPRVPSVYQRDGNGGRVHPPYAFGSGNTDVAYGVAIQPDGRIIAAGSTTPAGRAGGLLYQRQAFISRKTSECRIAASHASYAVRRCPREGTACDLLADERTSQKHAC